MNQYVVSLSSEFGNFNLTPTKATKCYHRQFQGTEMQPLSLP